MTIPRISNCFGVMAAAAGAFALTFLFLGLALAIYPGWSAVGAWAVRIDSPNWIQAFGGIATVFATLFVLGSTVWLDARRKNETDSANLQATKRQNVLELNKLLYAAQHVRRTLGHQHRELNAGTFGRRKMRPAFLTRIQGVRAYSERIPVWNQPNPELFKHWSQLLDTLTRLDAATQIWDIAETRRQIETAMHICTAIESVYKTPEQEFAAFYHQTKLSDNSH